MIAFVPTVVPWQRRVIDRQRSGVVTPSFAAASSSAAIRPSEKSCGVDGALVVTTVPDSSTTTQSVNVPPMSTPQR
jgi:hypothetical protein